MAHRAEDCHRLNIRRIKVRTLSAALDAARHFEDVLVLKLPACGNSTSVLKEFETFANQIANNLGREATLIVIGEVVDLAGIHEAVAAQLQYQQWLVIKRKTPRVDTHHQRLPNHHFGATIYTRYKAALKHTLTRVGYTYCPACDKTTKDYGGKKHTYHEYGTLISDVWRDIACDLEGELEPVIERLADLFGLEPYNELLMIDLSSPRRQEEPTDAPVSILSSSVADGGYHESRLILGDCIEQLQNLPDNFVDFVFTDPPYNLKKKYRGYSDDLHITEYFEWCDTWISELARVLRPGRTLALLNIPLWSIRHFHHLKTVLQFQNWIAWDALSYPVRHIMPAHYTILCFSKGESRPLPGLVRQSDNPVTPFASPYFQALDPLAEGFCLRNSCIQQRRQQHMDDRGPLTDLWWDIHRVKHNTRRVDHPTQLPPQLMYRLISLFTQPGEMVLDCFNGSGTTTLTAHQLERRYIGIEKSPIYHDLAVKRHTEITNGFDPFRKEVRQLTAKNSPVARLPKQKYEIPKKTLQLEVKRVAEALGRLPTREDMIEHSRYPIRYYDEYFNSWGEVRAAARTTGMKEDRIPESDTEETSTLSDFYQPRLL